MGVGEQDKATKQQKQKTPNFLDRIKFLKSRKSTEYVAS